MKIAVLLSGGVDSFVASLLLKEQGYDVTGLTMINWNEAIAGKAARVARSIGIEHKLVDVRKIFQEKIVEYFCRAYERGDTPNPCVKCNKIIKFGVLLKAALDMGFDMVATGHYARIEFDDNRRRYLLKKASDISKDQSYFLYALNQEQLARILFPLGELKKKEVFEIAGKKDIAVWGEKESQELCFVDGDYRGFLQDRGISFKPGEIVDLEGNVLGSHKGLPFYTVGQRRGLGISSGNPVYVVDKDFSGNRLIVGGENDLYRSELKTSENNFIYLEKLESPLEVEVKVRYKAQPAPAVICMEGKDVKAEFTIPQRAVTQGQSAVYYLGDYVFGGGIIV
ncbi:MAG: tRNA 2-thiouridine(34) synthase MnmA [Syntrophomonadaceae bacterium]|nr:tRNA 2-thiouridine(34) synthase MnmA [Syntrophomonadaceae bacterium]